VSLNNIGLASVCKTNALRNRTIGEQCVQTWQGQSTQRSRTSWRVVAESHARSNCVNERTTHSDTDHTVSNNVDPVALPKYLQADEYTQQCTPLRDSSKRLVGRRSSTSPATRRHFYASELGGAAHRWLWPRMEGLLCRQCVCVCVCALPAHSVLGTSRATGLAAAPVFFHSICLAIPRSAIGTAVRPCVLRNPVVNRDACTSTDL